MSNKSSKDNTRLMELLSNMTPDQISFLNQINASTNNRTEGGDSGGVRGGDQTGQGEETD